MDGRHLLNLGSRSHILAASMPGRGDSAAPSPIRPHLCKAGRSAIVASSPFYGHVCFAARGPGKAGPGRRFSSRPIGTASKNCCWIRSRGHVVCDRSGTAKQSHAVTSPGTPAQTLRRAPSRRPACGRSGRSARAAGSTNADVRPSFVRSAVASFFECQHAHVNSL